MKSIRLFWFLLIAVPLGGFAAIDITVDVTGVEATATTHSKKVFVERLELYFPNKRASQSVSQNSKGFYATARFKYLGNGPLTVRWMVDGHVIAQTTEILTFGKEVEIRSDKNKISLPTFIRGRHAVSVQLKNSSGIIDLTTRSIQYFVTDGVAEFEADSGLSVMYPKDRSVDPLNFHFRWKGLKNFQAYQIEVERLASKAVKSATVIKALSKIDVYAPSDKQRGDLIAGAYRWRVKGLYKDKKNEPLTSGWAKFAVAEQPLSGGVFISDIKASGIMTEAPPQSLTTQLAIPADQRLTESKLLIGQGKVKGGTTYLLTLKLQNSGYKDSSNLLADFRLGTEIIGRYPISISSGKTGDITLPIELAASQTTRFESISVSITNGSETLDQAAINLTVEPDVDIEALDFVELNDNFTSSSSLSFCVGQTADPGLVFSRMVSAQLTAENSLSQSYNQQGYFTFNHGQRLQFTAYLQDRGLGDWIDQHCPDTQTTLPSGQILELRTPRKLMFRAYPVDQFGQANGEVIDIGRITFQSQVDGFVLSPEWVIPQSGQYKITLHDISEPADLYATLPGGYPKYIHAAGFDFELLSVDDKSTVTVGQLRQATIVSGLASTTWKGDTSQNTIQVSLDNITVNMMDNPLHGEYAAGQIETNTHYDLSLYGHSFALKQFNVNSLGAKANLEYRLPDGYIRSDGSAFNLPLLNASRNLNFAPVSATQIAATGSLLSANTQPLTKSQTANAVFTQGAQAATAMNIVQPNLGELISFDDINIFNGGEFIARHLFDVDWNDLKLQGSDLALRLRGAQLIVDTSPHVNYSDYSSESSFTGIGFSQATLRVKVNSANNLFSVNNTDDAFLYGKAAWLEITGAGLSGEQVEVKRADSIADFFNQKAASELQLSSPYGFLLQLSGGTFSLEDSVVGGLDLSGSVTLPDNPQTSVSLNHSLLFQHLNRYREQFTADILADSSVKFSLGVFNYSPDTILLRIGDAQGQPFRVSDTVTAPAFNQSSEGILRWKETLSYSLFEKAGLFLSGGILSKGWDIVSDASGSEQSNGAFLVNATGLHGQWLDGRSDQSYLINGFNTSIQGAWMYFKDSALVDSDVEGNINIPYPVQQSFPFKGKFDQQAGLIIAKNGLQLPDTVEQNRYWDLPFWKARLSLPAASIDVNKGNSRNTRETNTPTLFPSPLVFDAENQRIKLENFELRLTVPDGSIEGQADLGGEEFMARGGKPPFMISTYINPDGQLTDTDARLNASESGSGIRFLGQPFDLTGIEFTAYIGNGEAPEADAPVTALPLVNISGEVAFSVFGLQQTEIQHTALGARVPVIAPSFQSEDGYFGEEGAIKVHADLKFINTYGRDATAITTQVNRTQGSVDNAAVDFQPFKSFVGEAELVLIDAFSMKGLAEAGLHQSQTFPDEAGIWGEPGEITAYERIGLGAGADILKAAVAGQRGIETATRLGGAGIAAVSGVEGMGEAAIELGTESVVFVESVALALAPIAIGGSPTPSEILHAVDSGLATTNKGIELLQAICASDDAPSECNNNIDLLLDMASIMLRSAGVVTHYDEVDPQEIASITLQTMDTTIPLLKQIDIDSMISSSNVSVGTTLNDKNIAALSLAQTQVVAARSLVDHKGKIPFADFIKISEHFITSIEDVNNITEVNGVSRQAGIEPLLNLSIALARESVNMAKDLKNNPNPQKLAELANDYIGLLCEQSDQLTPLLPVDLRSTENLMKPVMSVSSVILNQLSENGIAAAANSPQMAITFLRSVLDALSSGDLSSAACGGNSAALPDEAKGLLKIASHSLKPLAGTVNNEDKQVVWALEGVRLALSVMQPMAEKMPGNIDLTAVTDMDLVLGKLITTFNTIGSGLNSDQAIADGQRVLRLAAGIPEAFIEIIRQQGSQEATELMDIYVVLMQQLDQLLNHADELAQGNFDNVDLLDLPIQLISKTQNLSSLGQNEKLGLANVSHILKMSREVSAEKPDLTKLITEVKAIHGNIKTLGGTGPDNFANRGEIEQLMTVLEFLASLSADNQKLQSALIKALTDLIPMFSSAGGQSSPSINEGANSSSVSTNSTQVISSAMVAAINALVTALPVIDFTQDDRPATLDTVLLRLLNEAEDVATGEDKNKIARARNIILMADMNIVGFSVAYQKDNNGGNINLDSPLAAKEVLSDGSIREFLFSYETGTASTVKQYFPQGHSQYKPSGIDLSTGNLSETGTIDLPSDFKFTELNSEARLSLFNDYWNELVQQGSLIKQEYSDNLSNRISIQTSVDQLALNVKIEAASGVGNYVASRELEMVIDAMDPFPTDYPSLEQIENVFSSCYQCEILQATVIKPFEFQQQDSGCTFTSGCAFTVKQGTHEFRVNSLTNPNSYAIYQNSNDTELYFALNEIKLGEGGFSNAVLKEYRGPIQSETAGWNNTWLLHYQLDTLEIRQGDSFEILPMVGDISNAGQLTTLATQSQKFTQRRSVVGNISWDYNTTTLNALFSDGSGNWQLYRMPESFNGAVVIPQPAATIDVVSNDFNLLAQRQGGVVTDNAGLTTANNSIEIAAANPAQAISISAEGQVVIGGLPIEAAVTEAVDSVTTDDDGNTVVAFSDGSQSQTLSTHQGNIKVTKTSRPVTDSTGADKHLETVKVSYCTDPRKSVENCGDSRVNTRRFSYNSTPEYFTLDSERPPITPVTEGVNQALKHQLWVDIFRREAELFANPSYDGLLGLKGFMQQAIDAGLDQVEIQQQFGYILLKVTNQVANQVFDEYEAGVLDVAQMKEWEQNPVYSPLVRINQFSNWFVDYATTTGADINVTNFFQDFLSRSDSLWYRGQIAIGQSLPILNNSTGRYAENQNLPTVENIKKSLALYSQLLLRAEARKALLGVENNSELAELCVFLSPQVSALIATIDADRGNLNMSVVDARFAIDLEASLAALGCDKNSSLAEILEGVSGSLELISSDMSQQQKMTSYGNTLVLALSGTPLTRYTTADQFKEQFRSLFLSSFFAENSSSALSPAKPENYDARIQMALFLQQLVRRVDSPLLSTPQSFTASSFQDYKNALISGFELLKTPLLYSLKTGFRDDWRNNFMRLSDPVELVDAIRELGELYEKGEFLNQKLQSAGFDPIITFDENKYLQLTVMGESFDVIAEVTTQQTAWLDAFWLQQVNDSDFNSNLVAMFNQENAVQQIIDAAPVGTTAGLQRMDNLIEARLDDYFNTLSTQLDDFNIDTESEIDSILDWSRTLVRLLKSNELPRSNSVVKSRVSTLLDEAKQRIQSVPTRLETELKKITIIQLVFNSSDTGELDIAEWSEAMGEAYEVAVESSLAELNSNPSIAGVQKVLQLMAIQQNAGFNSDSTFAEVGSAIGVLVERAEAQNDMQQKVSSLRELIDMIATAQSLGVESLSFPATSVPDGYIDSLSNCIGTNSCTLQHVNLYYEFVAMAQSMGSESSYNLAEIATQMAESSRESWAASIKLNNQLPDITAAVTTINGRHKAAQILQAVADTLSFDYEADRTVLNMLVDKLRQMAAKPLANGGSLNPDPLETMAGSLSRRLYLWQLDKQQQLAGILNDNNHPDRPACMQNNQAMTRTCMGELADNIGIAESEIADTILPAIHYAAPLIPVSAGNKYHTAANVLADISIMEPWLKLSHQLMDKLPDPDFSTEADYRLKAIAELADFIVSQIMATTTATSSASISDEHRMTALLLLLEQQPELVKGGYLKVSSISPVTAYQSILSSVVAGQVSIPDIEGLDEARLKRIFSTLFSLSGDETPVNTLSDLLKIELLEPLLGEISCSGGDPLRCILSTGLNVLSLSLDSLIENRSESSYNILSAMATEMATLSESTLAEEFWIGMAAQGLNLTLDLVKQGSETSTISDASTLVETLVSNGMDFSITLLSAPIVQATIPTPVKPVTDFVLQGSQLFKDQLTNALQGDVKFPVAVAQMSSDFVFDTLGSVIPTNASGLVSFGQTVSNWNLQFANTNWALLMSTVEDPANFRPTDLITAFTQVNGIGQLTCEINQILPASIPEIPPAITLTPFVAVNELLKLEIETIPENERAILLVDVAAGLSNLWTDPMNCSGLSGDDKQLATLIRKFKEIELNRGGELAALSTVGNLGLGSIEALLPNDPVVPALQIAWNGIDDGNTQGPGISTALALGMSAQSGDGSQGANAVLALDFLEFTSKVPVTMTAVTDELAGANSPASTALRLVTGNLKQDDLLVPDRLIGGENGGGDLATHIKYAIPNGLLGILGIVRKGLTPGNQLHPLNSDDSFYVDHADYGYLKAAPVFDISDEGIEIASGEQFVTALQTMTTDMATQTNLMFLAGADFARLGITGLTPLFEYQESGAVGHVAAINQRSIFKDLAGSGAGFSGVSGGVQREWKKDWSDDNDFGELKAQMYGKFTIPMVVDSVGLMEAKFNGNSSELNFSTAIEGSAVVVGVDTDFSAILSQVENQLSVAYSGDIDVDFLGRTLTSINGKGFVNNFTVPQSTDLADPVAYAVDLAKNINIGQCFEAQAELISPPLSFIFSSVGAKVKAGAFAEKNGLEFLVGSRFGLAGGFYAGVPLFPPLPLGVELGGSMTTAYKTDAFDPEVQSLGLGMDSCVTSDLVLNFFGTEIPLAGANAQVKAFVEGNGSGTNAGFKIRVGANSSTAGNVAASAQGLGGILGCGTGTGNPALDLLFAPVKAPLCLAVENSGLNTLWAVLKVQGNSVNPQLEMTLGVGNDFPSESDRPLHIKFKVNSQVPELPIPSIGTIDDWGWPETSTVIPNLCATKLCSGNSPGVGK